MWEGAPARRVGRCTELRRTASLCRYALPSWLLEALNVLVQLALESCLLVLPTAAVAWGTATFLFAGEAQRASLVFEAVPLPEPRPGTWGSTRSSPPGSPSS